MASFRILFFPKSLIALSILSFVANAANMNADHGLTTDQQTDDNKYYFAPGMLVGGNRGENLNILQSNTNLSPGSYKVDIYINGQFISNETIEFKSAGGGELEPCLKKDILTGAGVQASAVTAESSCTFSHLVQGASAKFEDTDLRLDLYVPQDKMQRMPRGTVASGDLDPGNSMLFLNYDTNYYRNRSHGSDSDSGYLGINDGFNLGLWQFRQQSNFTSNSNNGERTNSFKALNSYLQRPLLPLKSELKVGDVYTAGSDFGSVGLRGAQIASDDRMLPDSQRGYAPTIKGVANTNAKVVVKQSGNIIYQTSVPPGAFTIDDLYPTSYQGDLNVEVQEADGHTSSFTVPFSAVADSVRMGQFKYNLSLGRVRNIDHSNDMVADLVMRYGLSNSVTVSSGVREAPGYVAGLFGAVLTNNTGAYGINSVYSHADVPGQGTQNGWRFSLNYSKTITPTNTNISLAAFRYSTAGFYDLNDVLGLRSTEGTDNSWVSDTYQQKNQFTATISQTLGVYGHLFFSGSTSNYRGGRSADTQFQAGYNFSVGSASYSLTWSRQKTGGSYYGSQNTANTEKAHSGNMEDVAMLSFSMPLGESTSWSTSYSHSSGSQDQSDLLQSSVNGTLGQDNTLSYDLTTAYDARSGDNSSISGSLQKQFSSITLGANASKSKDYDQIGVSGRGALVAHSGGVTLGPWLGDSFALVEAKGAEGAKLQNSMGASVDSHGYAIMPSLTPYRYNEVVLDPEGIKDNNVELDNQPSRVAPYAGAMVKVNIKTKEGYPLLLSFDVDKNPLDLGENIYDSKGDVVGMVSLGGMIYARVSTLVGVLSTHGHKHCTLPYDVANKAAGQALYRANAQCQKIS